ncbi:RNA polymerase sigma-70 factor [Carboxylicivirga marina]|uniref:RNA polymerase sigma-70 factor n=1 Tax=Carboxylicivirga marina TaxID=2800988 RepID=A0ABS1HJY5_9BACT|nr:RNA polymerase sigma-70 factor [Carboxylicivirga marina]MBK3517910.1 RNA polymerase sigma-70 factor [Carboxylicivirga marina]
MVPESVIAQKIKCGNLEVFQDFYKTNYKRLHNYATLFLSQSDEAEDVVQDAFINLWNKRASINVEQSIGGLLYRAIRNQCLNAIKHSKVKDKFIEFAKNYDSIDTVYREDFNLETSDSDTFYVYSQISKAIDELPQKRKEVYKLSKIEGQTHNEIAQQLDITTKGVERHITMANKALRAKLKHLKTAIFILTLLP